MNVSSLLEVLEKLNTTLPEDEPDEVVDLSREATSESNKFLAWTLIVTLVIALVGLMGNGTILWFLGFLTQRNQFSVYIFNLATPDFLFLLGLFPIVIEGFAELSIEAQIAVFLVAVLVTYISYSVRLSLLAGISTERCPSVLFPKYRCHQPKHTSTVLCALLWALPLLSGVIIFLAFFAVVDRTFLLIFYTILSIWFSSLIPVLCMSSLTLLLRVPCSSQRRQPPRLYGVVLLMVLLFLLCGVPLGINIIMMIWGLEFLPPWLSFLLASVNSSANPFIYFFLGKLKYWKKKEPLKEVLMRSVGNEAETGGDGERQFPTPTP